MMLRTQSTLCLFAFLTTSLFLLAIPQKGFSGLDVSAPVCCISGDSCVGCESGCSIPSAECAASGGDGQKEAVCVDNGSSASCDDPGGTQGCCVIAEGECLDNPIDYFSCAFEAGGTSWFQGTDCSEIPQCSESPSVSNILTLGEWGMIALAVVLVIAGFIYFTLRRRHSASA